MYRVMFPRLGLVLVLAYSASFAVADDTRNLLGRAQVVAEQGRFAEAEALLKAQIGGDDQPVVSECAIALEVLRRIQLDFSLTPEQMLERLRGEIPDVTAEEMEQWRAQGVLQHRVIDGETRYFKRAAGNLFRSSPEARKRRRVAVKPVGYRFNLPKHVKLLLDEAEQSGEALVHPVKHHVRYTLRVNEGHPRLKKGAKVRCWLPFPQEYRRQVGTRLISTQPSGGVAAPNGHPQRTVYFEQVIEDPTQVPSFSAEFEFTTSAYVPNLSIEDVKPYNTAGTLYTEFTAERPPHIVFTPELKKIVAEAVGDETNPLEKSRCVFRWIDANIPWCSEMEYGTIPCIPAKALAARQGDCGVQGLLFITMCRAAGVPARWQSGWETLPNRSGMHDWSEFYVEPWGWLPADVSYGLQQHAEQRVREFFCGHMDPYRLIVNLDYGRELSPAKISFRSEPNDFQRGEIEIDGHNLYFDEWSWDFEVETTPVAGGMSRLEEALDAIVPKLLGAGKIPGAMILVGRKHEGAYQTWQKAYGLMQVEPERVAMREDAIFDLASMTKPIATGTSLMILVERGQVGLDDPVGKYLPEFKEGNKQAVTARHLMTHTSGMPPYVGAAQQKPIKEQHGFPCPEQTRAYIRALDLIHGPGERVTYSCLNAILCAEIVETAAGMPLDRFVTENIFGPLNMTDSGYQRHLSKAGDVARFVPSTKAPYGVGAGGFLAGQVHDPLAAMQAGVSGNAGLFGTIADLSRFARMMLNGGVLDGKQILKAETIRDMTRVRNPGISNKRGQPDRRGLLWDLYVPDPGDTGVDTIFAYGHTGYTGTAIRIYPEQGVYVIALTNRVHPNDSGSVGEFRRQVWNAVGRILLGTHAGSELEAK